MAKELTVQIEDIELAKDRTDTPTTQPAYTYEFPYWSNKENRHIIVTLNYPDGRKQTASIMDKDGTNPDYIKILEEFGEKVLDENTKEGIKRRDENIKKRLERQESNKTRARQEQLFGSKLESFEIPIIKDSKNTNLKKLIRKAKSPMEVNALTAILIREELILNGEIDNSST